MFYGASRRALITAATIISVGTVFLWFVIRSSAFHGPSFAPEIFDLHRPFQQPVVDEVKVDAEYWRQYVRGDPTDSMFDNLKDDIEYIASWTGGGFTNDVMAFGNLIYLGMLTNRVAILPKYGASKVFFDEDDNAHRWQSGVAFGALFNLSRLSTTIDHPVIEWHHIKDDASTVVDPLGCWSLWQTVGPDKHPRSSRSTNDTRADVSYTPTPSWTKMEMVNPMDFHSTFWKLVALNWPGGRADGLKQHSPAPSELQHAVLPPNEQLMCIDYLYYVCAANKWEYYYDYSPAWRFVIQHLHFNDDLAATASKNIARALGLAEAPPYIAIHVRHNDFSAYCGERPLKKCFAPLSDYDRRVKEVQQELWEKKGIDVTTVVMTSDEKDPEWWADVEEMGWLRIDHGQNPVYEQWWRLFMDVVTQSHATGFVGTDTSTVSLLAGKRVETWADGAARYVKFGFPGADDH